MKTKKTAAAKRRTLSVKDLKTKKNPKGGGAAVDMTKPQPIIAVL